MAAVDSQGKLIKVSDYARMTLRRGVIVQGTVIDVTETETIIRGKLVDSPNLPETLFGMPNSWVTVLNK